MEVEAMGASEVGKVRGANEDAFLVDNERKLYIVADGMGGHQGGGYASQNAVLGIREELLKMETAQETTTPLNDPLGRTPTQIRLLQALHRTNEKIYRKAMEDSSLRGMGTTVTAVQLDPVYANIAHVGDSRIYLFRESRLHQLSRDHSWVQEQVDAGILTEEEARTHPLKNIITRSMGHEREVRVDLMKEKYQPGDIFLICSDGLTNMVDDQTIEKILETMDLQPALSELMRLALESGGLDNITIVLIKIKK